MEGMALNTSAPSYWLDTHNGPRRPLRSEPHYHQMKTLQFSALVSSPSPSACEWSKAQPSVASTMMPFAIWACSWSPPPPSRHKPQNTNCYVASRPTHRNRLRSCQPSTILQSDPHSRSLQMAFPSCTCRMPFRASARACLTLRTALTSTRNPVLTKQSRLEARTKPTTGREKGREEERERDS